MAKEMTFCINFWIRQVVKFGVRKKIKGLIIYNLGWVEYITIILVQDGYRDFTYKYLLQIKVVPHITEKALSSIYHSLYSKLQDILAFYISLLLCI